MKELLEQKEKAVAEEVRNLLNGETANEELLIDWFDLEQCDNCGKYELSIELVEARYDCDKNICPQCREDGN